MGRELQRLLEQFAVTLMQATPATWRMLLENNWEGKSDLRILCGAKPSPWTSPASCFALA